MISDKEASKMVNLTNTGSIRTTGTYKMFESKFGPSKRIVCTVLCLHTCEPRILLITTKTIDRPKSWL